MVEKEKDIVSFIDGGTPSKAYSFLQWKGTDVCMDFHCECGESMHIDGYFHYFVICDGCKTRWEMPHYLFPRIVKEP